MIRVEIWEWCKPGEGVPPTKVKQLSPAKALHDELVMGALNSPKCFVAEVEDRIVLECSVYSDGALTHHKTIIFTATEDEDELDCLRTVAELHAEASGDYSEIVLESLVEK